MSFLTRLSQISVVQTALALFGARFVTYLLPLVTVPYLARVLGPDNWGMVVFAQAIGLYFILVIDYSFTISATREVARKRDNEKELARIVSGVLGAKLLLALACGVVIGALQLTIPALRETGVFVWLALFWAIGFVLAPMFYFQGIEQVPRLLRVDIPLRIVSTACIFILVKTPGDDWKALFLQGLGGILIMLAGSFLMYRDIPFVRPTVKTSFLMLREGLQLFAGRVSSSLYWMSNPLVLGLVAPVQSVGFYVGAERLVKAIQLLTEPVTAALFPHSSNLAQSDPRRLARVASITTVIMTAWGILTAGILYLSAPFLISIILGPGYEPAVFVMRILALLLPIMGVSMPLVMLWMIPMGMDRDLMWIAIAAGILHIPLAAFLGFRFAHTGIAGAYVFTEVCSLLATVVLLSRKGSLPFSIYLRKAAPWPIREHIDSLDVGFPPVDHTYR
jgi:PST family polysaccharide transporter